MYVTWVYLFYATFTFPSVTLQMQIIKTESNELINADVLLWIKQLWEYQGLKPAVVFVPHQVSVIASKNIINPRGKLFDHWF